MDELADLVAALESAGCTVRGRAVVCAFHGDRNASGSIHAGKDGRPRYRCHGCGVTGDAADIIARHSGRPLAEVLRERSAQGLGRRPHDRPHDRTRLHASPAPAPAPTLPRQPDTIMTEPASPLPAPRLHRDLDALVADLRQRATVVDVYRYQDAAGTDLMAVLRLEPKSFRQASPAPGGGWWLKAPPGPLPLFDLPRIAGFDQVVVCEGEKDCRALAALGYAATTAPGGADAPAADLDLDGKPGRCDWSPLAGKRVVLWGDDDEPGRRHMQRVARLLAQLEPRPQVRQVCDDQRDGAKDAADFIAAHPAADVDLAVHHIIHRARPVSAAAALHQRITDAINGKIVAVPWPWDALSNATQALMPGAVVLLAGSPGASKSFMLLQAALWWLDNGWRVALHQMEETHAYWLNRALALLAGCGDITDPAWIALHPDRARDLFEEYLPQLDRLAVAMTCVQPAGLTHDGLAEWVEAQAARGARVICVDPFTAALETAEKPWITAHRFMLRAKHAIDQAGASLVLTTHGRKGEAYRAKGVPDLDSLAGPAALGRFASAVLWLEALPEDEDAWILDADARRSRVPINRRVRILKARNGPGTGMVIGCRFVGESLCLEELGTLVSGPPKKRVDMSQVIAGGWAAAAEERAEGLGEDGAEADG